MSQFENENNETKLYSFHLITELILLKKVFDRETDIDVKEDISNRISNILAIIRSQKKQGD